MEIAGNGSSAQRWVLIAFIALLGLAITAGASNAGASGHGQAVAAKKHCKKHKRSAGAAKKKKCKRKKSTVAPPNTTAPPSPTVPTGPTTRASITWDTADEVDLHVFDASGNHDFYNDLGSTIPNAVDNDQDVDGGPETFVDSRSPSTRTFTFYVCLYGYQDTLQTSGPVHVTADVTDPGGAHRSIPITLDGINDEAFVTVSPVGATPVLASGFCHPTM
jgi:hypothetical protein